MYSHVMSVGAIDEDVVFDHPAAAELAERLGATAAELERQAGADRVLPALVARSEWRGAFAEQFDQRLRQGCADGLELAAVLRRAAPALHEMATAARSEQRRRELARAWEERHRKTGWAAIADNVNDFLFGEDDIPPPPAPPPRVLVAASAPRTRGG
jgi:hypothetical protein